MLDPTIQAAEAIDLHLGRRVAEVRRGCSVSTPELALMIGLDPLDLSLREEGARRFSGAELKSVSTALDVPLATFYAGFEPPVGPPRLHVVTSRPPG